MKLLSFQNHWAKNHICSLLHNKFSDYFYWYFGTIILIFCLSRIRLVSSILHHVGCTVNTEKVKYVLETREWVLSVWYWSLLQIYKPFLSYVWKQVLHFLKKLKKKAGLQISIQSRNKEEQRNKIFYKICKQYVFLKEIKWWKGWTALRRGFGVHGAPDPCIFLIDKGIGAGTPLHHTLKGG